MKNSTARQLFNAIAAGRTRSAWVVMATYTSGGELKASRPMSYREAKATARAIREGCGYAVIERA
jgi:hypothetical protein